jgi:outer membrane protein assembly factor BamB
VNFSRRDILKAGGMLAIAPLLPEYRWLQSEGSFSFAYFSDTHVALSRNIVENEAMLKEIVRHPMELAINGGDVTDYGWTGEYENWWNLIKDLPFRVHHVAGNHDVRWSPLGPKAYREGTRDPMYKSFDHKGVHFVLLDSTVPLSHWGHYESEMLRWLQADLDKVGRQTPVFVATHHWVGRDRAMIDNEAELIRILEPYNVKMLLTGHGHNDLLWTINDMHATMNRGLYQGSWQRFEVDREKGEVRLSRRAGQLEGNGRLRDVVTLPLAAAREKRKVWQLPAVLAAGTIPVPIEGAKEARWNDGVWQPLDAAGVSTAGLIGGTHRLVVRADDRTYFDAGEGRLAGDTGVLRKRWEQRLSGGVMSHLLSTGPMLVVSAMDGSVTALDKRDGSQIWRAKTAGYAHSSPVEVGNLIVVGSADGNVYAFNRRSGERVWRRATGGPVYGSAAHAKGIVCIASGDGAVYGLDARTGERKWVYALPPGNTSFIQSPAATDGQRFYLGAWDKHLYALDAATGEFLWRGDCVGDRSWAFSPAIGGPAVGDGRVIVPANGNNLVAFDCVTGKELWNTTAPGDKFGYSSPRLVDGKVYIGCLGDNGEARCVDAATGEILWTATTQSVIYDSSPAVMGRFVLVGSVSGLVSALDRESGEIVGQYRMPTGHLLASPAADMDAFYVASYSDVVTRFDV